MPRLGVKVRCIPIVADSTLLRDVNAMLLLRPHEYHESAEKRPVDGSPDSEAIEQLVNAFQLFI